MRLSDFLPRIIDRITMYNLEIVLYEINKIDFHNTSYRGVLTDGGSQFYFSMNRIIENCSKRFEFDGTPMDEKRKNLIGQIIENNSRVPNSL